MKNNIFKFTLFSLIFTLGISFLFGEALENSRFLYNGLYHSAGSMRLRVSNYNILGSRGGNAPSLEYPSGSGINYLYQGSIWIGGKKHRRNANGEILYWLAQNPTATPSDSARIITQDDPNWNPTKKMVIDTLTTVGFDGDLDLYELLPAYNPLMSTNPAVSGLYPTYNEQDQMLLSMAGIPFPKVWQIPDPEGTYCFSVPSNIPDNNPGYETLTGFYYDYCPFGTTGDRDWGGSRMQNNHVPLGLAIEQQSYAWPLPGYGNEIIIKYIIKNTSPIDTLFDVAIGTLMDNDCGPSSWTGAAIANDDVSGYCRGEGYEFAYSRDADGDGGLTTGWIGTKLIIPTMENQLQHVSWYWKVGDGPDDSHPLDLPPSFSPQKTANEKYWLMTNHSPSPNTTKFTSLRPEPGTENYEQPVPNDTRYLNSVYGEISGTHPTENSIFLPPNSETVVYMAIMAANDLEGLKERSIAINTFINDNLAVQFNPGSPSIPLLQYLHQNIVDSADLMWFSYTDPDHFEMMYKLADAPASTWQSITMPATARTGEIDGLVDGNEYKFKIASIFIVDGNEVYLETPAQILTIDNASSINDPIAPKPSLTVYPNPFRNEVNIHVSGLDKTAKTIDIFDIKGQKVTTLTNTDFSNNSIWNGRDSKGNKVGSGIYFIRMHTDGNNVVKKVLFLK